MKIVFIGASQFGLHCLQRIINMPQITVVGIITNQQTFSISYNPKGVKNFLYADFSELAREKNIPLHRMKDKMTDADLVDTARQWAPQLLLVVGWYHMVPKVLRDIAPAVGLHASLLPNYCGGAPLVWAIINGEQETGISLFVLDDGVDSGDIIAQAAEPIFFDDTIATLYGRIELAGLKLLEEYLPKLADGTADFKKQDHSLRCVMPQRSPEDGEINWHWPAEKIYNFIRAQTKPYPGAFTFMGDKKLTIWSATIVSADVLARQEKNLTPGAIITLYEQNEKSGFLVLTGCKDKLLLVTEVGDEANVTCIAKTYALENALMKEIVFSNKTCIYY